MTGGILHDDGEPDANAILDGFPNLGEHILQLFKKRSSALWPAGWMVLFYRRYE
jgi:hypothetical protein